METQVLGQDEVALRRDLDSLSFRLGERRGLWAREALIFPYLYVRVSGPPRLPGPKAFLARFECKGYRAIAPTGALWDGRNDKILPLPLRPRQANQQPVLGFTAGCGNCFYHPIDRLARAHWAQHDELTWGPNSTIVTFLEVIHGLLHDRDYHSSTAPDAAAYLPKAPLDPAAGCAA